MSLLLNSHAVTRAWPRISLSIGSSSGHSKSGPSTLKGSSSPRCLSPRSSRLVRWSSSGSMSQGTSGVRMIRIALGMSRSMRVSVSLLEAGSLFEVDGRPIARRGVGKGIRFVLLRRGPVLAMVLSLVAGARWYWGGASIGCCSRATGWSQSWMYWGCGAHIVPSVGSTLGRRSGGSAQISPFLSAVKAKGNGSTHRCRFWSGRSLTNGRCRSSLLAGGRMSLWCCGFCASRARASSAWALAAAGLPVRGSLFGMMSPLKTRSSRTSW